MQLSPRQRAHLKSLAQRIKPTLQVGKEGASPSTASAILEALNTRELLKVKVLDSAPASARETGDELARQLADAALVQVIGRTLVFYRPHPERPEIRLPPRTAME